MVNDVEHRDAKWPGKLFVGLLLLLGALTNADALGNVDSARQSEEIPV